MILIYDSHFIQRLALLGSNVPKGSAISFDMYSLFVVFSSNKELLPGGAQRAYFDPQKSGIGYLHVERAAFLFLGENHET